jgi:sugar diacid utilization regulator
MTTTPPPVRTDRTLNDLLELPELADARIVPVDADRSVIIRAVAADLGGNEEQAEGTLLLGAPSVAVSPPLGCVAVIARDTAGADVAVPLIVLPDGANAARVTAAMVQAILGGAHHSAGVARRALREALIGGAGIGEITKIGADMTGGGCAVLDGYGDVVARHAIADDVMAAVHDQVESARALDPMDVLPPVLAAPPAGARIVEVPGAVDVVGALVLTAAGVDDAVVEEIVEAAAVDFAREGARVDAESRLRGELIEELVAGEVISRDTIIRRARLLGADLSNGAVGLIGTLKAQDPAIVVDDRVGRRFLKAARAVIDHEWPRALVDWSGGRMLALLPTPTDLEDEGPGVDERAHELARRLLSATHDTVPGMSVTVALSRHTADTERLGAALDEADLALNIGERLGRLGEVVTFEETGTYKLLFQIFADRPAELSAFYESTLAPLVAYDEQYQTALVGTLATYLELDGNLAATASTLYTHRHTVRYRLDRIAELAGLDVGKSDDREKLSLGLKAMRLLGLEVRTGLETELPSRDRS